LWREFVLTPFLLLEIWVTRHSIEVI
jgi:hypothetical protein